MEVRKSGLDVCRDNIKSSALQSWRITTYIRDVAYDKDREVPIEELTKTKTKTTANRKTKKRRMKEVTKLDRVTLSVVKTVFVT